MRSSWFDNYGQVVGGLELVCREYLDVATSCNTCMIDGVGRESLGKMTGFLLACAGSLRILGTVF